MKTNVRMSVSPSAEKMILICAGENACTELSNKKNWDVLVDVNKATDGAIVENCLLIDCAEEVEALAKDSIIINKNADIERCERFGRMLGGSFVEVTKGDATIFALYTSEKDYVLYQVERKGISLRASLFVTLLQLEKKIPIHVALKVRTNEFKETFESVEDYYVIRLEGSGFFLKIKVRKNWYELSCEYSDVDFGN